MQAARLECLSLHPFSLFRNDFALSEVDVGRCDIVEALMVPLVTVVVDECHDPRLAVFGQDVALQQHAARHGLVLVLDLALCLLNLRLPNPVPRAGNSKKRAPSQGQSARTVREESDRWHW